METLQLIGIIVVFLGAVALMMTRKLPTILALPIMAILISVIAGVPFMSEYPDSDLCVNINAAGARQHVFDFCCIVPGAASFKRPEASSGMRSVDEFIK